MTIDELLEKVQNTSKRLPDMEKAVFKAVDDLDVKEPARFPLSPSATMKPMRDLYYALVNYYEPGEIPQDPIPASTKLTFKFGHYVEGLLKDYFREAFHLKDEQRRVTFGEVRRQNEFGDTEITHLSGAIDWAVKIGDETILMDSKSIRSYPFKLLTPKDQSPAPKEDNIAQMQLYMHSDWGRKNNVNKAILSYFCKDSSEIKCIQINYDATLAEALLQRLYKVWDYYVRGEVPPREYILGVDWQADYSNFRTHDFAEFALTADKRAEKLVPKLAPKFTKDGLKAFVIEHGNAVVNYSNKSVYVTLGPKGDALEFQEVGQKVWNAV